MKTLTNFQLLYDGECPMCAHYADKFVRDGVLTNSAKTPYGTCEVKGLDTNRARNEIALVDNTSGDILYGLASWQYLLSIRYPAFKTCFYSKVAEIIGQRLYRFISYNRKVIAIGKQFESKTGCTPDFNLKYRLLYILLACTLTVLILQPFSQLLHNYVPTIGIEREWLICFGQLVFQFPVVTAIHRERLVHYWGNLMTVSLIGSLLLLPVFLINTWITIPSILILGYFGSVVLAMLIMHMHRCKVLELGIVPTITWIIYRLLILSVLV